VKRAVSVAAAIALLAAAPPPEPTFAIGRLKADLPGNLVIGRARSGLICGPAGALRWRDASPGLMDASHRAAAAMHGAGLDVAVPDPDVMEGEDERTLIRIVPTLAAIHMNACTAWRGVKLSASQGSVKASGRIAVIWRAYDWRTQRLRLKVTSCTDFNIDHGTPTVDRATEQAIAASGTAIVAALATTRTGDGDPQPERIVGCRPGEPAITPDA
jgi:hypothetical protein